MTRAASSDEQSLGATFRAVVLVGAAGVAVAGLVAGARSMLGVAFGGALAFNNLWAIRRIVRACLFSDGLIFSLVALLKLGAVVAAAWALVRSGLAHPVSIAIGYGALPLGIVAAELRPRRIAREDV